MTEKQFVDALKNLNIVSLEEQLKKLSDYAEFLIEYNKNVNLTRIDSLEQIYLKHFYDSLTICEALDFSKVTKMLDIGSGAGFPGMVLAIFFPKIKVTLLDSNNKKTTFLKLLAQHLKLNNVTVINARAEEYCKEYRESFELVTARAVANLTVLSELCIPFVKEEYYFISMKGSNSQEITEAESAIEILGAKIEEVIDFQLPNDGGGRNLVKIKKISKTKSIYPRRYDKIIKNPLKKKGI